MSDFAGLAAVSATLRNLLRARMEQPPVPVTIAPPDVEVTGTTGRRVNLYLYQVTKNGHLANQEIPNLGHPADYGQPPLPLDLHYLLTAYGNSETGVDADLEAQQILGDAMRALHEAPIVTASPILDARLTSEFEKVKVTLQPMSLEQLSSIWAAFSETNFRRSVAYLVSVVQIESRRPRRQSLPVRVRRVYAIPFRSPHVVEIVRDPPLEGMPGAVAETGDTIRVLGENLAGAATVLRVGSVSVPIPSPQPDLVSCAVPATVTAGTHAVQVVQDLLLEGAPGQPLVPHRGRESNSVPLLILPRLVGVAPNPAATGTVVTVTVDPPVLATQRKVLLLDDVEITAEPVDPSSPPSTTVDFRLATSTGPLPPQVYLARARVDGAESRLTVAAATGLYDGPTVTVV